jgi:hypothetical protein
MSSDSLWYAWPLDGRIRTLNTTNRDNPGWDFLLCLAELRFAAEQQRDWDYPMWMGSTGRGMAMRWPFPSKHTMHKITYMILLVVTVTRHSESMSK